MFDTVILPNIAVSIIYLLTLKSRTMNNSIYLIPTFVILFIFTCSFNASGQCPSDYQVIFTSQQDVDAFAVNYPNCTQINAAVRIGTYNALSNITDLSPLNQIEIITGSVTVRNNPLLTSFNGLENLFFGGSDFSIINNATLTDISALSGILGIQGLEIINNSVLPNLEGLENMSGLFYLRIRNNPLLSSLGDSFINNASLNDLQIIDNDALTSLSGLEGITNLTGIGNITNNNALTDLSGLENITNAMSLNVINNSTLNSLNGLQNLSSIHSLIIAENDVLTDISGIRNIDHTILNNLVVRDNSNLSTCNVESVCNYLAIGGVPYIENNLTDCAYTEIVYTNCGFSYPACPLNDDVKFSQQQNVDLFAVRFPDCTVLNSLVVDSDGAASVINNLSALNQINTINEHVYITRTDITDLTGLGNLVSVGEGFRIYNNNTLTNFNGLENLTSIGGEFVIRNNSSLVKLIEPGSLNSISGQLHIENNDALVDLTGLESLMSIDGQLQIKGNSALVNLVGLENLTSITDDVIIISNPALLNLTGLNNLTSIDGLLTINHNHNLASLSGLENLMHIPNLGIANNSDLENIDALNNIDHTTLTNLSILNNFKLSICYTQSICNYLLNDGESQIEDNAPGCSSPQEVQSSCIALPVELTHFAAEAQRGGVLLTWQTASETNNQGFDIQRSKDGINWEKIGYQQGAGNSTTTQDYRHNDTQPLSGINYYRLKQIDVEGDFIYSDVVSVSYGDKGFAVFPVPAKDEITLQLESPQTTIGVRIINVIGEVIHAQELHLSEGVNQVTLDISDYTKGVYFLTIDNGNKNGTQRFVKH